MLKINLGLFLRTGERRKLLEVCIPCTFTVPQVSDLGKKEKRKKKWFAIYCQGHSSGERPIKTNDPLESPTLAKSGKKEGRAKLERDVHGMHETPLVRIAFQPWLVHLLRTKRWHPPTLRGNQTCRGKLFDEDRMTSGPSFHLPLPREIAKLCILLHESFIDLRPEYNQCTYIYIYIFD